MSADEATASNRVYGNRARIGVIVPTTNTVNESEWSRMCDGDISFHTARMPLHAAAHDGPANSLPEALRTAIDQLTPAGLTSIAYSCTAGSMITPVEALPKAMSDAAGVPCTSTAAAIVAALSHLGIHRIAVATPYHDAVNTQWRGFLESCDFEVTVVRGLGIGAGGPQEFSQLARLSAEKIVSHALDTFRGAPGEALLISCTDVPTLPLLPHLEATLGVPVVTSNTATLWRALQLSGITANMPDAGHLMQSGTKA